MKVLLNERQLKDIEKNILLEETDDLYTRDVKLSFYLNGSTYNGQEIDDVESIQIPVNFKIDVQYKRWGIDSAYVYDIKGPETVELTIRYYPEGSDDWEEGTIEVKMNWEALIQDTESGTSISINDEIECEMGNDENGSLIINKMSLDVYGFN